MRLCFKNNLRPHTKKDFNEIKKQKILSILEAVFLFEEKKTTTTTTFFYAENSRLNLTPANVCF